MAPHLENPFIILTWHILVGYLITVTCDWNWIPLTPEERKRGRSIDQIRSEIFDLDGFIKGWKKDFKD
ncbi:hypothetical protein [Prochlorococcus sp. MIT 1223]|uniref:hypothetical protein n=1 Tax=Prochlorococcus sp. MIT 1223 TaxID=3096217 RepID=UPI002A754727|nr:hypothetical protein [Prochlorococcus sp. MIT 1223]